MGESEKNFCSEVQWCLANFSSGDPAAQTFIWLFWMFRLTFEITSGLLSDIAVGLINCVNLNFPQASFSTASVREQFVCSWGGGEAWLYCISFSHCGKSGFSPLPSPNPFVPSHAPQRVKWPPAYERSSPDIRTIIFATACQFAEQTSSLGPVGQAWILGLVSVTEVAQLQTL